MARAVYRELLDTQWTMGSLPNDPVRLQAIVQASQEEWEEAWAWVAPKFVLHEDGYLRNPRLEVHRVEAVRLYMKRRAGAETTNRKRREVQDARS